MRNEYNGTVTPQIKILGYEVHKSGYIF
jgi:hypothetical protein